MILRFFNFCLFCQCIFDFFCYHLALEKHITLHLNKRVFSSLMDAYCQVWLKFPQLFWRRKFNVFSLFYYYLLLGKGIAFHLNKREFSSLRHALFQVWLKLAHWFFKGSFSLKFVNVSLFITNLKLMCGINLSSNTIYAYHRTNFCIHQSKEFLTGTLNNIHATRYITQVSFTNILEYFRKRLIFLILELF